MKHIILFLACLNLPDYYSPITFWWKSEREKWAHFQLFCIHWHFSFFRYHLNSKRSSSFFCNSKKHFHTTYRRKLKIEKGHQSQQVLSVRNADYSTTTAEEEKENDVSKAILIWRAVKLPIYSVALVPLTVSSLTLCTLIILECSC